MNSKSLLVLPQLIGKTLAHIVIKEGASGRSQLLLVFSDDTYYEFYCTVSMEGASAIDGGGYGAALAYCHPQQKTIFSC